MVKFILKLSIILVILTQSVFSQYKVHSHNDYLREQPFWEAYNNKVFSIEADVFLLNDELVVAHSRKEVKPEQTLQKLYIKPVITLFNQNKRRVSEDPRFTFQLMVDFKDDWKILYPALLKEVEKNPVAFNRVKNKRAVAIVVSGNRPPDSEMADVSDFIWFDGLPFRNYKPEVLKKIAMISDNFKTHSKWNGETDLPETDKQKLLSVINDAHKNKKPVRFWNAPDNEKTWKTLIDLGVDIINTDKINECSEYLNKSVDAAKK